MPHPDRFTPRKDAVTIVQEAGWTQGRSGWAQKILSPPGFNPRTIQPVASCYTNYGTPAHDSTGKVNVLGSDSIGHCKKSSYEHVCTSDMHTSTAKYIEVDGIVEQLLRSVTNLSFKY
jgi:hypothetical protein